MDKFLNLSLMKNPLNWIILLLMVIMFTVGVDLIRRYSSMSKGDAAQ